MAVHLNILRFLCCAAGLPLLAESARKSMSAMRSAAQRAAMELQSQDRAHAMFEAEFAGVPGTGDWPSCPYGDKAASELGGETSFSCHWKSKGMGSSCPDLQAKRLRTSRMFQSKNYQSFVNAAGTYPLWHLFNKSSQVAGDETYERLDHMQIGGLMDPAVVKLEDKIQLKSLAKSLGIPATDMYYSAHASTWNKKAFARTVGKLCLEGTDAFMIKATHLAWSAGMKIVRGWQADCQSEASASAKVDQLSEFIEAEILSQHPHEADAHLKFLEPGVTVEELFHSGGNSRRPLEAKVQTVWGKAHHGFFIGEDPRGCLLQSGSWQVYADGTGWDIKGMIGSRESNDEINDALLKSAWPRLVQLAEKFAKGVGADWMRVDFFVGFPKDGDELVIKMNECESVSGHPYWHERHGLGAIWRDGYLFSDNFQMTSEKWRSITALTQQERDAEALD